MRITWAMLAGLVISMAILPGCLSEGDRYGNEGDGPWSGTFYSPTAPCCEAEGLPFVGCSPTSCTPITDPKRCRQLGGAVDCVPCDQCGPES